MPSRSPLIGRYKIVRVDTFEKLIRNLSRLGDKDWIFRGHRSVDWPLATSFERELKSFQLPRKSWSKLEGGLLRAFQRRAHHYLADTPEKDSWLEWLSLMRHYGAPTRLLDWTYSYYVAAFFALERADRSCAVWAMDAAWLGKRVRQRRLLPEDDHDSFDVDKNMEDPKTYRNVLARAPKVRERYVFAVNP